MRKRYLILVWIAATAILFVLYFLHGITPMKEFLEWLNSSSPIITLLTAVAIAFSGWIYHHNFNDSKKNWLSDDGNYTLIVSLIILIVIIAFTIYNNSTIQSGIPIVTSTTTPIIGQ